MGVANLYPFLVSTLAWERRSGTWSLTICLKATYALQHGQEAKLAADQDGIHDDIHWDNDPEASLYSPSDFAPFKPHADILLVGHASTHGGVTAEELVARLGVGDISKALRITGDRVWLQQPGGLQPSAPRPFTYLPLRHERAARRGENLGGVPATPTAPGKPLPNIDSVDTAAGRGTPGFGALPPRWRALRDRISDEAFLWSKGLKAGVSGPPPDGFEFDFFNVAPRDQQLDRIPIGPTIVLENLHRQAQRFEARLPALVPSVFYVASDPARPIEAAMRCDTLWIDIDRSVAVLSWRGVIAIAPPAEQPLGKVVVAAHAPTEQVSYDDVARLFKAPIPSHPLVGGQSGDTGAAGVAGPSALLAPGSSAQAAPAKKITTAAMTSFDVPMAMPFPLAEAGNRQPAPLAPIPGAPWSAVPAAPNLDSATLEPSTRRSEHRAAAPEQVTAPAPVTTAPALVNTAPAHVNTAPQPVDNALQPVNTAPAPVNTAPQPVNNALQPVNTAPQPVNAAPQPVVTAPEPIAFAPEAPGAREKVATPGGSPWKVEPPPLASASTVEPPRPRATPAVKSSLYEDFRAKKR